MTAQKTKKPLTFFNLPWQVFAIVVVVVLVFLDDIQLVVIVAVAVVLHVREINHRVFRDSGMEHVSADAAVRSVGIEKGIEVDISILIPEKRM